ncbi:MAG: TGS domain-containing protein [Candidatus Eisenbacteria bacterium]|nr:TGS domain-containing protein [Candidatus Latescibacterota bacterium]MBD3301606.1 TGS domain-containing protein [Candidatus Eisenbacteria bacterium]
MPANLSPDYQAAEQRYRNAETYEEKIEALREMLATIPKHKGTEKLQADIKRRLSKVQQEQEQRRRSGGRRHDPSHVPREGAGQIALIGPPNAGKSALLAALTHARPDVADYPFTTHAPQPGMMPYEDVQVQLVDTPPLAHEPFDSLLINVARNADAVLLLLDPTDPEGLEHAAMLPRFLARCRIVPEGRPVPEELGLAARVMPVLLAMNKCEEDPDGEVEALLREPAGEDLPFLRVSAATGDGLDHLRETLFGVLRVLRVYAKEPGKAPDTSRPFVVPEGATVLDLARIIHKDFAENFRFARLWGSAKFDGQPVERDHALVDRDVVEIHM